MENAVSPPALRLASDHLCPYVQRAVIVAAEKGVAIERRVVDLAAKPGWFTVLSPTGKVPLLEVGEEVLFESAPIVEYLDEISPGSLHPATPLARARHRAWIEFASGTLSDIAGLYNAPDRAAFEAKERRLAERFAEVEAAIRPGPWFDGDRFHIVDAVWGPVFRYFDTIDPVLAPGPFVGRPKVKAWRDALARRPSVRDAVGRDYPARLAEFLQRRNSYLASRLACV
jgi:glutathione S-transferase